MSYVTGQRSNQLNYVPNRGINNLPQNLANKAFARFAYSARSALCVKECGCFRRNRPQTAYKYLRAHARVILTQMPARDEAAFRSGRSGESQLRLLPVNPGIIVPECCRSKSTLCVVRHAFLFCWLASKPAPISFRSRCFRRNFLARNVRALTLLTLRPSNLSVSALVKPFRSRWRTMILKFSRS